MKEPALLYYVFYPVNIKITFFFYNQTKNRQILESELRISHSLLSVLLTLFPFSQFCFVFLFFFSLLTTISLLSTKFTGLVANVLLSFLNETFYFFFVLTWSLEHVNSRCALESRGKPKVVLYFIYNVLIKILFFFQKNISIKINELNIDIFSNRWMDFESKLFP